MNIRVQESKTVFMLQPVSRSTPFTSAWVSMRNHKWIEFNVRIGTLAGTTPKIRLRQAKNVAGYGDKALDLTGRDCIWYNTATDVWTKGTPDSTGIAGAASTNFKIYCHSDWLDADNDFDSVALQVVGTDGATLLSVDATPYEPRYSGDPSDALVTPSAAIDGADVYGD